MAPPPDLPRLIGDLIREGVVTARTGALCRVAIGDIETGDIPWLVPRAGKAIVWAPPAIGEQVMVLCGEGDIARGVVVGSLYSDQHDAPADDESWQVIFDDGAWMGYDPGAREATIDLGDGTDLVLAPGKLRVTADVEITGTLTASVDVVGGGKSLKAHKHLLVQPGQGVSGGPQ